jgi:hypothetical protein
MEYRVGRHLTGAAEVIRQMGAFYPEKAMDVSWPSYAEVMEKKLGAFLHDPAKADPKRVFTN